MYDELYEVWKAEKLSKDLQPIRKDFYEQAAEHIKRLRETQRMMDNKTLKARLLRRELENSKRLLTEITATRFQKMLNSLQANEKRIQTEFLTREEESIYTSLLDASNQFSLLTKALSEGKKIPETQRVMKDLPQKILVRFTCEMPAIIGVDLKTYGPFKPEDVASLPTENATALINQGAAVKVEVERD